MTGATARNAPRAQNRRVLCVLAVLGVLSACGYAVVAALSGDFRSHVPGTERPIPTVLLLFAGLFAGYLVALRWALRADQNRKLLAMIVGPAIVFRLILLFSVPIQEIDIYRYLWDGAAVNQGVSPFRYSPEQVLAASTDETTPADLRRLAALRDGDPALAEILGRIHFGYLPTVYPPASQAVFAAAALATPEEASVTTRLTIMKALLVAFDVATLLLVVALLRLTGRPVGLSILYAWCPLLMKEVANSGHLDSIAVFLTTLAVYLAARVLVRRFSGTTTPATPAVFGHDWFCAVGVAVVLALAVGAKLYPIVLAPLLITAIARAWGWRPALLVGGVFGVTCWLVLSPMTPSGSNTARVPEKGGLAPCCNLCGSREKSRRHGACPPFSQEASRKGDRHRRLIPVFAQPTGSGDGASPLSVLPAESLSDRTTDPSLGLKTFLQQWEMNDFFFLLLVENLKPADQIPEGGTAWFSIVPDRLRTGVVQSVGDTIDAGPQQIPFLVARMITAGAFLSVAAWLLWRVLGSRDVARWLEAAFLTLAWFWLLCPTQNPWYWTWVLPLLPFARGRAWLAMSGLVLLYYLRFWFRYHWPDDAVPGTAYNGTYFFDFVVTWLEYAPWLVWLAVDTILSRGETQTTRTTGSTATKPNIRHNR